MWTKILGLFTGSFSPYLFGGLGILIVSLGLYGWHLYDRIDVAEAKAALAIEQLNQAKQINADNKTAFDRFKADTEKAQAIVARAVQKQTDTDARVDKARTEIHNATPVPISPNLVDTLDRVRALRQPAH